MLKTHGMLVDEQTGEKLSKSGENYKQISIEDLMDGSIKADGERKFGYGLDAMRVWCATKDTDRNIFIRREQME